ncbi:MAG: ABC transporter substrate-binding protein [Candidatus Hydrogenedentes bacterium]|nr:ABC transporter substrate-binding protein [Candidatus Hydrogenedentota bacterium]
MVRVSLACAAVLALVVSCTPRDVPAQDSATPSSSTAKTFKPIDPTSAVCWDRNTLETAKLLDSIATEYNATQPPVPIKLEYLGNYGDIFRKVSLSIQARELPATAVGYEPMTSEYIVAGAALPLDDYIADPSAGLKADELADFYPSVLETNKFPQFENRMYSFPFCKSVLMMYYNKRVLREAGFDAPPQTWDEFLAQCRAIKSKTGKQAYAINVDCSTIEGFIYSMGGEVVNGSVSTFDQPNVLAAFKLFDTLVKEGLAYQAPPGTYDDREAFAHDRTAFFFRPSSHRPDAAALMAATPDDWGMTRIPQSDPNNPRTALYGPNICVFRTTDAHQKAAWGFIKHFTSPKVSVRWAIATGYLPIRKSAANDPDMQAFWEKWPQDRAAFDCLAFGKSQPNVVGWQQVRTLVERALTAVISGLKTPEQATADLKKEADKALAAG